MERAERVPVGQAGEVAPDIRSGLLWTRDYLCHAGGLLPLLHQTRLFDLAGFLKCLTKLQ